MPPEPSTAGTASPRARENALGRSNQQVGGEGLEQGADSAGKSANSQSGGAESGAVGGNFGAIDPDLARLIGVWPTLREVVRASILAMVKAAAE